MKKIIFLFATFLFAQVLQAQITDEDYRSIIPYLQAENWKKAYTLSTKLLQDTPADADSSEYRSMVVYCRIYAAAGMASQGKMNCQKLLETLNEHKGQAIFLAGHLASNDRRNTLNKTFLTFTDGKTSAFTTVTSSRLKIILLEEIELAQAVNPETYAGSTVRCGGTLAGISLLNGSSNKECVLKIRVTNGFVRLTR